jgi:hypothetical protein
MQCLRSNEKAGNRGSLATPKAKHLAVVNFKSYEPALLPMCLRFWLDSLLLPRVEMFRPPDYYLSVYCPL